MAFRLAELFVEITGRDSAVGKIFGGIYTKMSAMGALGLRGGQLLAHGLWGAFNKSSDLGETTSKVQQVFGDATAVVTSYADQMAEAFGAPKRELLDAAAQFGLIAEGLGMSQAGAAQFSTAMAQLAADTASFYNLSLPTALEKIRAGLTGEAEPLKALGVIINETMVQQRALAMGFRESNGQISEQAKFAARAALINEGLAKASGDLARTYDSDANQMKAATGRWENAITSLGSAVEPAFAAIVSAAGTAIQGVSNFFESNRETVTGWAAAVGSVFDTIGFTFTHLGDIAKVWWLQLQEKFINAGEIANWLMGAMGKLGEWFANNWVNIIKDGLNATWTFIQNTFLNIRNLVQATWDFLSGKGWHFKPVGLLDGFKATLEELPDIAKPEITSLQDQINAVYEEIGGKELALQEAQKKRMADLIAKQNEARTTAMTTVKTEMKAAEKKMPEKAQKVGLEEFAKKLQEGVFGKEKVQQSQQREQQRIREATEKTAARMATGMAVKAVAV